MKNKKEQGITLIALIITIIVLVILAAVSISVAYKSKVIEYATESTQDYAQESIVENKIMEGTTSLLDSIVERIAGIFNGEGTEGGDDNSKVEEEIMTNEKLKEEIGKYVDYQPDGTTYRVDKYYSQRNWK